MPYDIHSKSTLIGKRFNNMKKNKAGFTFLELMVVVAIMGIIATMASPSYRRLVQGNAVKRASSELESSFSTARIKAYSSGRPSTLCPVADITAEASSSASSACLDDWDKLTNTDTSGWIVFQDSNKDNRIDNGETIYKRTAFDAKKTMLSWTGKDDIIRISARNTTSNTGTMRIGFPSEAFSTWSNENTPFHKKVHETRLIVNTLGNITHKTTL